MAKFIGSIKQLTLGKLLILLSFVAAVIAALLIFFLSETIRNRAIHELAREDAQQTSKMVFQSLYSAMRKGWSKQEINDSIQRLNANFPELKIRVYRGDIVTQQFGAMSGEEEAVRKDADLSLALQHGKDAMTFPDEESIRYLY